MAGILSNDSVHPVLTLVEYEGDVITEVVHLAQSHQYLAWFYKIKDPKT